MLSKAQLVTLFLGGILVCLEAPKLYNYMITGEATAGELFYHLNQPPNSPVWIVPHVLAALYLGLTTMQRVYVDRDEKPEPYSLSEYASLIVFVVTVMFNLSKLSTLRPLPASLVNSVLLAWIAIAWCRGQSRTVLAALAIPLLLTLVAEIAVRLP
jgi:hypothetical protein